VTTIFNQFLFERRRRRALVIRQLEQLADTVAAGLDGSMDLTDAVWQAYADLHPAYREVLKGAIE
jgi:hypothetical protein